MIAGLINRLDWIDNRHKEIRRKLQERSLVASTIPRVLSKNPKQYLMCETSNATHEAIFEYAKFLRDRNWRTTYTAVGAWLKHSELKRSGGERFEGSARGAAKVIADTYDYVQEKFGPDQAQIVFCAFCNERGLHNSRGDYRAVFSEWRTGVRFQ